MNADATLNAFVDHFLLPIAADHNLDATEETPLFAAYRAFGVEEAVRTRPSLLEQLRALIATSSDRLKPDDPLLAWALLRERSHRVTQGELIAAYQWCRDCAMKQGLDPSAIVRPSSVPRGQAASEQEKRTYSGFIEQCWLQAPHSLASSVTVSAPVLPAASFTFQPAVIHPDPSESIDADPAVEECPVAPAVCEDVSLGTVQRELRARAAYLAASVRTLLDQAWAPRLAFDEGRLGPADVVAIARTVDDAANIWFIGDIHGDLLALECALAHIRAKAQDQPYRIVFLGDLIDDGPFAFEVVIRVLQLVMDQPESVCLLAGNHDEALRFDPGHRLFTSWVSPSDFADELNERCDDELRRVVAQVFIDLMARSLRALFLPDGLLAAHGGIPQSDLWGTLGRRKDFASTLCLQDFVWTRAHPRAARRVPDRTTRGAEFGRDDFTGFCALASRVLGQPVKRMVRGHDHIPERFSLYSNYRKNRLVTVNTLSRRLTREWGGALARTPCVARWRAGALPDVHRLLVPEHVVARVYPEPEDVGMGAQSS